jgi:endonuclease/exonuclease/phosphatase family metal-dependent hydrolase
VLVFACSSSSNDPVADAGFDAPSDAGLVDASARRDAPPFDPSQLVDAAVYEYDWACTGDVPATGAPVPAEVEPPTEDCSAGVWPDLDARLTVCPTWSGGTLTDPASGLTFPLDDEVRTLPVSIPVSEGGSFLSSELPSSWPTTLKVVAWNMEYSRNLDDQLTTLTTHPALADADVYLLNEVDRCSTRNGVRRAARELARAIGGQYVYGIEFVELNVGRTIGGDTGQAIVSRRPLTGAALLCHSAQSDWLLDDGEPRLGSRVVLHADVPAGDEIVRVWAVHLESDDILGEKRAVQSKELLDEAQRLACDRPQIVAGDFNAWYPRAPELVVLRDAGFVDALERLGDVERTHDSGRRLDYLFARGPFEIVDGAVLRDVTTSDHFPLVVTLRLDERAMR